MVVTSVISFVLLLGGIGGLAWFFAASRDVWRSQVRTPAADPLITIEPTPSMNATHRYFWVVGALAVGQIIAGIVIAHYGVEGTGFYGFPLSDIVPYSLARTWHVQMGMLWIATSWLATGLCLAPLVAGHEPRLQRLGVNVLLVALVVVVGGSMFGQALAIHQVLSENTNFWIGHQGYEYLDLGRLWQTLLFVGLLLWLVLMIRPLMHAWKQAEGNTRRRQFLGIFMLSVAAIALFYDPGSFPASTPTSPSPSTGGGGSSTCGSRASSRSSRRRSSPSSSSGWGWCASAPPRWPSCSAPSSTSPAACWACCTTSTLWAPRPSSSSSAGQ